MMSKFVQLLGMHGRNVWINVSQVSAVVAASSPGECAVYVTGDDNSFKINEPAEEVLRKFAA